MKLSDSSTVQGGISPGCDTALCTTDAKVTGNTCNEYVDDIKGQRTGTPARYEEHMVRFNFLVGSTVTFRPELSYTKRYSKYKTIGGRDVSCTDIAPGASIVGDTLEGLGNSYLSTGRGKTQSLTMAADVIFHF